MPLQTYRQGIFEKESRVYNRDFCYNSYIRATGTLRSRYVQKPLLPVWCGEAFVLLQLWLSAINLTIEL